MTTTPKHRAEQFTPTRPQPEVAPKHRRKLGPTLSDRLQARAS